MLERGRFESGVQTLTDSRLTVQGLLESLARDDAPEFNRLADRVEVLHDRLGEVIETTSPAEFSRMKEESARRLDELRTMIDEIYGEHNA